MIVVNARFLTQKVTGVQRYAIEICKRLPKFITTHEIVYVAPKGIESNEFSEIGEVISFGIYRGQLWEQLDLPLYLKTMNYPLLVNLVGIGPIFYKNKILALYDLAFKHHPEWFSLYFQKAYNFFVPISVRNSKHIITDSQYVKGDIQKNYNVETKKISVIYAATDQKFTYLNLTREKYILTVSSIEPRKNLLSIIKAYNLLNTDYKLVIVGKSNSSFAKLQIDKEMENSNIVFTGYLTDDELVKLYNTARIFVYASYFEGFGIPPLEAQACGCSCIVSNATCLPEIYQDSVLYCNPTDIGTISSSLEYLIKDKEKRYELQKLGFENVRRFSWDSSYNQLKNLLKSYI